MNTTKRHERHFVRRDRLTLLLMKQVKTTAANFLMNNPAINKGSYFTSDFVEATNTAKRHIDNAIDLASEHMEYTIFENTMMRKKLAELGIDVKAFLGEVEDLFIGEDNEKEET